MRDIELGDVFAGRLYAVGGHDGYEHLGSGEMFDPVKNCWTPIAAMNTLRYTFCMCIYTSVACRYVHFTLLVLVVVDWLWRHSACTVRSTH